MLLYNNAKKYLLALRQGLELRIPDVLFWVQQHNLYSQLDSLALCIMEYDFDTCQGSLPDCYQDQGVSLLVNNHNHVSIDSIVKHLSSNRLFQHIFLDVLFQKDSQEGSFYHPLQVELYAEHDPSKLLDFLKTSLNYDITKAYELCEKRDFVPEMVYLLGKMGNNKKALYLVIERLGDVEKVKSFRLTSGYA